tara:strand:- start:170 stop:628 length:459 start_codon:yes stop_codon:yes gene_type:complete
MDLFTIYLILLIIIWTLNPFLKRESTQKIGIDDFIIISAFIYGITIIIYCIYEYKVNKKNMGLKKICNLNKKDLLFAIFVNLIWVTGALIFVRLVNMKEISYLMPQIQCVIIALTIIIGYLIFNESFSITKGLGILLIIVGILLLNMKVEKK